MSDPTALGPVLTCLVSETSNRDRWQRVSISRFWLDWRKRNREAIKSRRFLSCTLRYVAQKRWVIRSSFSFSNPDWQVLASPPKRTPLYRDRWSHVTLDHWECACDPKWSRSQGHVIICKSCLQSCTKCLSRHISGIFVCYSLSIWVFLQSCKTADSPNSQYIEFSIEVFSLSPAATQAILHNR